MEELPYDEYLGWRNFFSRRPIGWEDDLRTYYIMSRSGMSPLKQKVEELFPRVKTVNAENERIREKQGLNNQSLQASPLGAFFARKRGG